MFSHTHARPRAPVVDAGKETWSNISFRRFALFVVFFSCYIGGKNCRPSGPNLSVQVPPLTKIMESRLHTHSQIQMINLMAGIIYNSTLLMLHIRLPGIYIYFSQILFSPLQCPSIFGAQDTVDPLSFNLLFHVNANPSSADPQLQNQRWGPKLQFD